MTTIAEFIKFLETLPQEAIVEIPHITESRDWDVGKIVNYIEFKIPEDIDSYDSMVEVIDYKNDPDDEYYGKVFVRFVLDN